MKNITGTLLLGQSGGPTSVINASAAGVFLEALKTPAITQVLAAHHGLAGILNEDFIDISQEDPEEIEKMIYTPSSLIGSVRLKLKGEENYQRILQVFKKYDIRFFIYNGGNDSMDTCQKISRYLSKNHYQCNVMGLTKTIDNDLAIIDHTPGYGSAAKWIATTMAEITLDAQVYDTPLICVCEVMGRHAGWLTAATEISKAHGYGPDLTYLPEIPFNLEEFYEDVAEVLNQKKNVIIAVSEGIMNRDGQFIVEYLNENTSLSKDAFGHKQLGGTATSLANALQNRFRTKVRAVEFSLMQRCGSTLASQTDIREAVTIGRKTVKKLVSGTSGKAIGIFRRPGAGYRIYTKLINLVSLANVEKLVPERWIKPHGKGLTSEYLDYVLPLIKGRTLQPKLESGIPDFAKLKMIKYKID
jgi:6-phosphofructokinase 1